MVPCKAGRQSPMPVRSLTSCVLKWPDAAQLLEALESWADSAGSQRAELLRVGCFGSWARGDWGAGSDLDVIPVVSQARQSFVRRAADWDLSTLPVPCDVLVYTPEGWARAPLVRALAGEIRLVWERAGGCGLRRGVKAVIAAACIQAAIRPPRRRSTPPYA
ncbi:MAG: nucleotidyltransferase domain-containing protein [Bryobacteraceae bacterium]